MLEEDAAMNLVYDRVPPFSEAQRLRAFALVMDEASQNGVTSLQDNSIMAANDGDNYGWQNFPVLQQLNQQLKHDGKQRSASPNGCHSCFRWLVSKRCAAQAVQRIRG